MLYSFIQRPLRFPEPEKTAEEKEADGADGEVRATDSKSEFGDLLQPPLQTESEIEMDRYMTTPPPGRTFARATVPPEQHSPFDFDEYEREFGQMAECSKHLTEPAPAQAPAPSAHVRHPMSSEREVETIYER